MTNPYDASSGATNTNVVSPAVPSATPTLAIAGGLFAAALAIGLQRLPQIFFPGSFTQFLLRSLGQLIPFVFLACWWLFFSRAKWTEKLLALGIFGALGIAAKALCDKSVGTTGLLMAALPYAVCAFGVVAAVFRSSGPIPRQLVMTLAVAAAWMYSTLIRIDGVDGDVNAREQWRWEKTREQLYLEHRQASEKTSPPLRFVEASDASAEAPSSIADEPRLIQVQAHDWPAFRGPRGDGVVSGVALDPDWKAHPPQELWRIRIGPGWSSFAAVDGLLFTQEQRGPNEVVVCLNQSDGREIWSHAEPARFEETASGIGPRATPTFVDGRLYTMGASGLVQCLDAATGKLIWKRELTRDAGAAAPAWGFASSPVVIDGQVVVSSHAKAPTEGDKDSQTIAWIAYNATTGEPTWRVLEPKPRHTYCSAQVAEIAGVRQLLLSDDNGVLAVAPSDGATLWRHEWIVPNGHRVNQPLVVDGERVLIGTGYGLGTRSLRIAREGEKFSAEEEWTSRDMNPYFNDFVAHRGHLFGFHDKIFGCLDLKTGKRTWIAGRYGCGQCLLLPDADQLLVVTEKKGEIVLVAADPTKHRELGKFKSLPGKTWNHPVLVQDKLFVRNDEEAACYKLSLRASDANP